MTEFNDKIQLQDSIDCWFVCVVILFEQICNCDVLLTQNANYSVPISYLIEVGSRNCGTLAAAAASLQLAPYK